MNQALTDFAAAVETQSANFGLIPPHLLAADNHNVGNDGFSWFSPRSWYDSVSNLPSFAAVSVLSGANSFYNTGVAVANFFGAEAEYNDTGAWIATLDSNLGEYYSQNRQSADLVGFIVGSFIPGLAGMKVLSAGQKALTAAKDSGYLGSGLGKAVGLLNPSASFWTAQSAKQIATAQTTFSAINANTARAIGAGFGEAALQSAAFETAVAATMFKSPILEDMDLTDLTKNIAMGAALGTVIGGVFTGAKTFGTLKKKVSAVDEIEKAYTFTPELSDSATSSDKIVYWLDSIKKIPPVEIGAKRAAQVIGEDSAVQDFVTRFTQQAAARDNKIWNLVRIELGKMSSDAAVTESLFNALRGMDSDQIMRNLLASEKVARFDESLAIAREISREKRSSVEALTEISESLTKAISKAVKLNTKGKDLAELKTGPLEKRLEKFARNYKGDGEEEIVSLAAEIRNALNRKDFSSAEAAMSKLIDARMDILTPARKRVAWVKLWGDDAGKIVAEKPKAPALSDIEKDVDSFVARQKFKVKTTEDVADFRKPESGQRLQARYIWASKLRGDELPDVIASTDLPVLERAYLLGKPARISSIAYPSGKEVITDVSGDGLLSFIKQQKEKIAQGLLNERVQLTAELNAAKTPREAERVRKQIDKTLSSDDISKLLNVRRSFLEGQVMQDQMQDLFAYQSYQKAYQEDLIAKKLWTANRGEYDLYKLPQWAQIGYRDLLVNTVQGHHSAAMWTPDGHLLQGISYIKTKEKLHYDQVKMLLEDPSQAGQLATQMFDVPEEAILKSNRFGAGAGLFSFANGSYGSLASIMESIGATTRELRDVKRAIARDTIEPVLLKIKNNSEAALELQAVFQQLAATSENFVLTREGLLRPQRLVQYEEAVAAGKKNVKAPELQAGIPPQIEISNPETLQAIEAHVRRNGERLAAQNLRRNLLGEETSLRPDVVYVPKPDTKDYPHFFFVVDETVTAESAGRVRMVHAASAKDLESLRAKIPPQYTVVFKGETEEYYKALGQYNFERTLHNSNMDVNLKRAGVNSQFLPKTDPHLIADDLLNWHLRQEDIHARDIVSLRYGKEFNELERLGEQYTGVALSRYGYDRKFAENVVKNPYVNYIKTALDISKIEEYPMLATINRTVDRAFSEATRLIGRAFANTNGVQNLEQVNDAMQRYGLKTAFADMDSLIAANHTAPRGALTKFVRDANALLATTVLRLDPLNAINNAVGAHVMLGAETKSVLRMIADDSEAVGKLAGLTKIAVPGAPDNIALNSAGKLIANAIKDYAGAIRDPEIIDRFRAMGYITDLSTQYHKMMDELTLRGTESVSDLNARIERAYALARKIGDKGEKWTLNRHAEEMNRFIAAHVMTQITDIAISAGKMNQDEAISYVRTFVNRTQGNIIASQRPMIFQGPIGQAVGLFQTYQFNLIQQLLRYVGEGTAKDAAMLLGLQGTIYGLNGLPAFGFINQHLVGTASGNKNHTDIYTATYGAVGNDLADLLLYGLPSNLLGTNLFTRGDINPRHPTIVPVNPMDVPIVATFGKFLGSVKEAASKSAAGGNAWESLLQGIEHAGLSRPAAGVATLLRGIDDGNVFSTSTRGNILYSHDLFSWASVTRLVGGKPFDEARLVDSMHRFLYYNSYDRSKRVALAEAFKTITIDGTMPNPEQIENFAAKYAERGGDSRNFNKWMMEQIKNSQTSQINKIAENLKSPLSQQMQILMGGEYYPDARSF